MTVSSDEAIATWTADIATVRALVQDRNLYQIAASYLASETGDVVSFLITSGLGVPVNIPIASPLDEQALALVSAAVDARLAEIAASLLEFDIVDE